MTNIALGATIFRYMNENKGTDSAQFTLADAQRVYGEHNVLHAQQLLNQPLDASHPSELSIALAAHIQSGLRRVREAASSGTEVLQATPQFYRQVERDVRSGFWIETLLIALKAVEERSKTKPSGVEENAESTAARNASVVPRGLFRRRRATKVSYET